MKLPKAFLDELLKMAVENTTNKPEHSQQGIVQNDPQGGKQPKRKPEDILLELATKNKNLYYDKNGVTYLEVHDIKLQKVINTYLIKIESSDFDRWITREYHTNYKAILSNKHLLDSIKVLVSEEARLNGQKIELHNRIATIDGSIYIDLGTVNRQCVKVDKSGWHVGPYPVFFQRHNELAELPTPISGGNIKDLLPFLPPLPERDQCLVLCWLIASFFEKIERAFLLIEGPQGSGKSTLAKLIKSLIHPTHGKALTYNDNVKATAQMLDHHCIPLIDNVTNISKAVSDLICTAYSDGVYSTRKQYTNDEDFIFNLTGNVIFTTIRLIKPKSDFLNRCYKIELKLTEKSYRSKQIFTEKFDAVKAQIFGAVLDVIVATLNKVDQIPVTGTYRTVDFDRYATAAAEVLGYGTQFFLQARKHCEQIKIQSITNSTPIIEALSNFLKSNGYHYIGNIKTLLENLQRFSSMPEGLPNEPNAFSRRINEMQPELLSAGITAIRKANNNKGSCWEFRLIENNEPTYTQDMQEGELEPEASEVTENYQENGQSSLMETSEYAVTPDSNPLLREVVDTISLQNSDSVDSEYDFDQLINDVWKKYQ